jgi:regulator of protease activity HflC (stomatin/prohibitin superfamily)
MAREEVFVSMNPWVRRAVIIGIVLVLFLFLNPFYQVGIGEVAVVFNTLSGKTRTTDQGLHMKLPLIDRVSIFDVRTAKMDYTPVGASKDLQQVTFEITLNYHLQYDRVNDLFTRVGRDYQVKVIAPAVMEIVKSCAARFPVEQIIVQRQDLKDMIEMQLREKLTNYFIIVEAVNIVDIDFTPEFNKVVEEKQIEEQRIKTAQYVRLQAEENKKTEILKAEAEAAKQRMLQQSATREIVSLKWIEKWDGKLPSYMTGDSGTLIQMPK